MAAKTPYAVIMDTLQPMLEPEHADAMAGQITAALGAAGFVFEDADTVRLAEAERVELMAQLNGLIGLARFIIDAADIDADQTRVTLKNKGKPVAEVTIATVLELAQASLDRARCC